MRGREKPFQPAARSCATPITQWLVLRCAAPHRGLCGVLYALDERLFALQDANWNVTAVADPTGAIQERYAYTPYGTPFFLSATFTPRASSQYGFAALYTGREYDAPTGLHRYNGRHRRRPAGADPLPTFLSRGPAVARFVSFAVLVAILLAITFLFFRVMANFLLPVFLAVLLVVIFAPLHRRILERCAGREHLAAGLTTLAILLIFLVPMLGILFQAAREGIVVYKQIVRNVGLSQQEEMATPPPADAGSPAAAPPLSELPIAPQGETPASAEQLHAGATPSSEGLAEVAFHTDLDDQEVSDVVLLQRAAAKLFARVGGYFGLTPEASQEIVRTRAQEFLAPLALSTTQFLGHLVIGLFVLIVSLFYFFADGRRMLRTAMNLIPLDNRYLEELVAEFGRISRAVVLAAVLAAIAQGLLAGIGFFFAGINAVFLLMALTMLLAMIPFVGAVAVWLPVSLWLFFYADRPVAAVILAVYGASIVSTVDNIIKPVILHGQSNLHPLLALLSVLGGVQALGPIGIFVGPMVVAFLHALLKMLHSELETFAEKAAKEGKGEG